MVGFLELIRRAQADETRAQQELLTLLRPHLERLARVHADPVDVEKSASDLVQEALVRVWRKLDQFAAGPDDRQTWAMFLAWVKRIVARLELNARRARKARRRNPPGGVVSLNQTGPPRSPSEGAAFDPPGRGLTGSSSLRLDERNRAIHKALDELPDALDAAIVRLRFFGGISLRQIARHLDLSYDQARQRYRSGVQQLQLTLRTYRD